MDPKLVEMIGNLSGMGAMLLAFFCVLYWMLFKAFPRLLTTFSDTNKRLLEDLKENTKATRKLSDNIHEMALKLETVAAK